MVRADSETGRGGSGAITPALSGRLLEATRKALIIAGQAANPVLVVPDHRRRLIRSILGSNGISTPVLGFEEIDPSIQLHFVSTVETT